MSHFGDTSTPPCCFPFLPPFFFLFQRDPFSRKFFSFSPQLPEHTSHSPGSGGRSSSLIVSGYAGAVREGGRGWAFTLLLSPGCRGTSTFTSRLLENLGNRCRVSSHRACNIAWVMKRQASYLTFLYASVISFLNWKMIALVCPAHSTHSATVHCDCHHGVLCLEDGQWRFWIKIFCFSWTRGSYCCPR